jgi:hypothetical protein
VQPLGERRGHDEPAAGRLVDAHEVPVVAGVERPSPVDGRDVNAVAEDPVATRLGAGGEGGRVDAGDGREDGVAVRELDAVGAEPEERRRVLGVDGVRAEAVDDEDEDEARRRAQRPPAICGSRNTSLSGPIGWNSASW